MVNQMKENMKF